MKLQEKKQTLLDSHTHLQATQINAQPKLANKYACSTAPKDNKALAITANWLNGGGSGYINNYALNLHCAYRQVSATNPPLRQLAKRCA